MKKFTEIREALTQQFQQAAAINDQSRKNQQSSADAAIKNAKAEKIKAQARQVQKPMGEGVDHAAALEASKQRLKTHSDALDALESKHGTQAARKLPEYKARESKFHDEIEVHNSHLNALREDVEHETKTAASGETVHGHVGLSGRWNKVAFNNYMKKAGHSGMATSNPERGAGKNNAAVVNLSTPEAIAHAKKFPGFLPINWDKKKIAEATSGNARLVSSLKKHGFNADEVESWAKKNLAKIRADQEEAKKRNAEADAAAAKRSAMFAEPMFKKEEVELDETSALRAIRTATKRAVQAADAEMDGDTDAADELSRKSDANMKRLENKPGLGRRAVGIVNFNANRQTGFKGKEGKRTHGAMGYKEPDERVGKGARVRKEEVEHIDEKNAQNKAKKSEYETIGGLKATKINLLHNKTADDPMRRRAKTIFRTLRKGGDTSQVDYLLKKESVYEETDGKHPHKMTYLKINREGGPEGSAEIHHATINTPEPIQSGDSSVRINYLIGKSPEHKALKAKGYEVYKTGEHHTLPGKNYYGKPVRYTGNKDD